MTKSLELNLIETIRNKANSKKIRLNHKVISSHISPNRLDYFLRSSSDRWYYSPGYRKCDIDMHINWKKKIDSYGHHKYQISTFNLEIDLHNYILVEKHHQYVDIVYHYNIWISDYQAQFGNRHMDSHVINIEIYPLFIE